MNEKSSRSSVISRTFASVCSFFKPIAKVALGCQMIRTVNGQECFDVGGKLYRFFCYSMNEENSLSTLIDNTCSNVKTGAQYCPPYPGYIIEGYGTGYFGGVMCYLQHKAGETAGCVIDIVKNNVTHGVFGSDTDHLAVFGICFGGAVGIGLLTVFGILVIPHVYQKVKANAVVVATERSRLMNDDRNPTAPNQKVLEDSGANEMSIIISQPK